jgi:hypothetical protein
MLKRKGFRRRDHNMYEGTITEFAWETKER